MSGSTKNTMFLKSEATPEEIKKDKRNLLIYDMASSVVSAILIITFIIYIFTLFSRFFKIIKIINLIILYYDYLERIKK